MRVSPRKSQADAAETPPFRSVGFMLSSLGYAVSRRFHHVLAPLELEPSQFAVLRAVGFNEGQPQQALAQQLNISPSHMVAIVDELERRELLERRPEATDRRVRTLHLTRAGEKLLAQAFELAKELEQLVSKPLSAKERTQLLDVLDRIAEGLDLGPGAHPALREHVEATPRR
jgi:DNA-binding MarR family transcriptional regulator